MKKGDKIYCIDESVYSEHITKRNSYEIFEVGVDSKKEKVRIKTNRNKLAWIPSLCFVNSEIPKIISINIDDKINDSINDCIEVTITFNNGERRCATFMTIEWLNGLFNEHREYVTGTGLILLKEINESNIKKTIAELDKQNELIELTIKY